METQLANWAHHIAKWAASKKEIGEVWFFGGRVRGDHRSGSDLDVAIVMRDPARSRGERYGDWVALGDGWESELNALLPVTVDLDIGDADIAVNVVGPAVRREGSQIYPPRDDYRDCTSPSPLGERVGVRGL